MLVAGAAGALRGTAWCASWARPRTESCVPRRALDDFEDDFVYREEVSKLKALRAAQRLKVQSSSWDDDLAWLGQIFPWLVVFFVGWALYTIANPTNDVVPAGRMPRLSDWLKKAPQLAGSWGGRAPPAAEDVADARRRQADLKLETVSSLGELWEQYTFSTREIVQEVPSMAVERNFIVQVLLQLTSFPTTFPDWNNYEACAVQELEAGPKGTVLESLSEDRAELPEGEAREVVLECGKMIDSYGLSLIIRDPGESKELISASVLRVKRLPEGCHISDDMEEPSVQCTVDLEVVLEAGALEAVAYIESIAVSRPWRGAGLASRLLNFMEDKARAWGLRLIALHVHRDNWSALRFYEKKGFEVTSDWLGWGDKFFLLLKPLEN